MLTKSTGARTLQTGTVYGVMLNDRATQVRLASAFNGDPYKTPPKAPILYIKPRNTFCQDGAAIEIPGDPGAVRLDATIGAVIGRRARRLTQANAASFVAGYLVVSDLTLPHDMFYRPAIRQRCRDGFCPMGPVTPSVPAFDPARAKIVVSINQAIVQTRELTDVVRDLPTLLSDVTEFMTLEPGDVLLLGLPDESILGQAGDRVRIDVEGLTPLNYSLVAEA